MNMSTHSLAARRRQDHPAARWTRRFIDVVVSAALLALSSPVLLVAVLAIRLESRGPAIFKQVRLGENRKPFVMYKLRGMYVDAKQRWPELYRYDGLDEAALTGLRFHEEHDPRVTRVGGFLRRTSIDELPNLVNVLKGDMHLVGPRPEVMELAPYYTGDRARIFEVRPGVTSLAKATGRDALTFGETVALELDYLQRRCLALDLKILVATAVTVLAQRNVRPGG